MSDTKFTPAPWEYRPNGRAIIVGVTGEYDGEQVRAAIMLTSAFKPKVYLDDVIDREAIDATGHLIAAAPDLYAACEEVLRFWHEGHDLPQHLYNVTVIATRKARGE